MKTNILKKENQYHLVLEGRLDTLTFAAFETDIAEIFQLEDPDILIDCSGLSYISSSGLRVFLMIQKYVISKKGKLVLIHLQPAIKEVFDMTGFSDIFTISPS